MAGHSKWANIKHRKGAADARKSKMFSKLAKYIMVAARNGGGNPQENLKLRYAIEKAKAESMPKDSPSSWRPSPTTETEQEGR